uniref:Peptidoglycan recognition protein 5 n=1 Tax=Salmo trutta TaxID=8032 RepID=A0A674BGZ0_SALTR
MDLRVTVEVVTREQWGAVAPRCWDTLTCPAQRVVIHHTALLHCGGIRECIDQLIHIQTMHMQDRNFDDIGYNFLAFAAFLLGEIAQCIGANGFRFSVSDQSPSPAALSSVKQLLQCGVSQGHLHPGFTLHGHRDLGDTECPGDGLYAALKHLKFP